MLENLVRLSQFFDCEYFWCSSEGICFSLEECMYDCIPF